MASILRKTKIRIPFLHTNLYWADLLWNHHHNTFIVNLAVGLAILSSGQGGGI